MTRSGRWRENANKTRSKTQIWQSARCGQISGGKPDLANAQALRALLLLCGG
jgi:hypothetical protein